MTIQRMVGDRPEDSGGPSKVWLVTVLGMVDDCPRMVGDDPLDYG